MRNTTVTLIGITLLLIASSSVFGQDATGACCVTNGGCQTTTAAGCDSLGGVYKGEGTACTPNPCDCCGTDGTEMRGNANMTGGVNIVDVTYIVFCFAGLFPGDCFEVCKDEIDMNADGRTNVVDLSLLVAYLFKSGPPPAMCP